jgi:multidrug efflux system membrane fusion protein
MLNISNGASRVSRVKAWGVFAIIFAASFGLHGCSSSPTADNADGNKGKGGGGGRGRGRSLDGGGPVPVVVAKVGQRDVPIELTVVGNVEAYSTITVIPQVGGQLTDVYFNEGDYVKKGDKLFTIDQRPLAAQFAQAQANMARDNALLNQSQANLARDTASEAYARAEAGRYAKLFDEKIVSREQADQYKTNADTLVQSLSADRAAIESAKAQIASDQAAIDNAKVQLSYTTIPSPIDGRTGNLMFKLGNVVSANQTNLITITQVEPIYVTFAVPEAALSDVKRYMAQSKLPVTATTQDGQGQEQGVLTFVDNNVDMTTGTIKLKGTFPNTNRRLWPGQYVNVVLRETTRPHALVVPNQAVQSGQDGSFVYVVKPDRTVMVAKVTTGPRVDQDLVVESGLQDGDTVVTEGQLRLAPGSRVQARDAAAPADGGGGRRGGRGMDAGAGGGMRGPNADAGIKSGNPASAGGGNPAGGGSAGPARAEGGSATGGDGVEGRHGGGQAGARHGGNGSRGTGPNPGGGGHQGGKGKRRGAGTS